MGFLKEKDRKALSEELSKLTQSRQQSTRTS